MLPDHGRPVTELLAELTALKEADLPVRGGKVTAYVYDTGLPEVHEAAQRAYAEMLEVNMLDPTAFPSMVALERQVVGAVAELLGRPGAPGIFTSGGTESIMLAVKAARDARPGATRVVLPVTAHPAFHKAAHYLGMEVVPVPVDPVTYRASVPAFEAALDDRTALAVVSAPPTRRAWSTRSRRSPRSPPRAACRATWTPASAAGCCRGCARRAPRSRRST